MIKRAILLFSLGMLVSSLYSQTVNESLQRMPPSPQAYAFAQYAEMPVSLFTGTPSINIPLFTIESGPYRIPMSLSYHASGIKVSQEASWVGLGWNLNIGGSICRSVRGLDDFLSGYYDCDLVVPSTFDDYDSDFVSIQIIGRWNGVPVLTADAEPDVFYYNFMGYSGKFYSKNRGEFESTGNGFYLSNPDDNLKIEFSLDSGFKVTTPDGTVCLFALSETSLTYSTSYDWIGGSVKDPMYIPQNFWNQPACTSWELSKIIFPNKEEVIFDYTYANFPFRPVINTTQYYYNPVMKSMEGIQFDNTLPPKEKTVYTANITTGQRYLSGIRWKSGWMHFETSVRRDFCSLYDTSQPGLCPKLDKVCIYRNGESAPLREFTFHTSYFNNHSEPEDHDNLRLRLDSLSIGTQSIRDVYRFGYDCRYSLPPKYSFSQDIWGYYNNRGGQFFYPTIEMPFDFYYFNGTEEKLIYEKGHVFSGADRSASPEHITTAMLTSIESPEGAITKYTYEPNQVATKIENEKVLMKKELYTKAYNIDMKTYDIDLPYDGYINLIYLYEGNIVDPYSDRFKDNLVSLDGVNISFSKVFGIKDFANLTGYDYSIKRMLECPAGKYRFTLRSSNYINQKAELEFYGLREKSVSMYGGGVRIAKITSPISTHEYVYTNDTGGGSSGIFVRNPFHLVQHSDEYASQPGWPIDTDECYLLQQSSPVHPLESPMSNTPIGYRKVSVITRSVDQTTVEDFYFSAREEKVDLQHVGMPGEHIYMNGKQLEHRIFLDGKLHQQNLNTYEELVIDSLNALFQESHCLGQIFSYKIPIHHCRLKTSTTKNYDPQLELSNQVVTRYEYNRQNYLISNVSIEDGTGVRTTQTTYPVDIKNSPIYNGMCQRNQISIPIEVRSYKDGVLTKKELHTYKQHAVSQSYVPAMDYSYYLNSAIPATDFNGSNFGQYGSPDMIYLEYDNTHNPVEVKTRTGQSAVYIWGYNKQYLIAQILNATLAEVKAAGITDPKIFASGSAPTAVEWGQLNNLRQLLPKASVTIFQYAPLNGITVSTDPRGINTYYEYDAMGRLVVERDNDRNIIKTYHYTLKNER